MKWVHYTKQGDYFKLDLFKPIFEENYPIPKNQLKEGEIGKLGKDRIIIKKMTKKEVDDEWNKNIRGIYNYLQKHDIPYIKLYKETKKKVLIGKFLGIEMWIRK